MAPPVRGGVAAAARRSLADACAWLQDKRKAADAAAGAGVDGGDETAHKARGVLRFSAVA